MSLAGLALVGVIGLVWHGRATEHELGQTRDLHQVEHVTSQACTRCHQDHAESFRRTFHRTMTQEANDTSVRGSFNDKQLDYFGVTAHMERAAGGKFVIRYGGETFPERRFELVKTVGSRRYQQYLARDGDALVRLPIAFHIDEQRWFHMNGAFLTPDPDPAKPLSRVDYERHVTRWNDNCVFCHNVAPNPGLSVQTERFDTRVAELGIACEACHGPGEEHVRLNASPWRRYRLHLSDAPDPSIVNPARLSPERSADICGHCHGQRITDDVDAFLRHGDPFVPGEDLALYSAPLWRDTTLQGQGGVFAARFWRDGTPRLTAYEYQGMLLSACSERGELTCTDCHGMHSGDPRGQIRPEKQKAAMCTGCHAPLARAEAQSAHAKHNLSDGSPSCSDCHMPKTVYGVLDAHPTHRISNPDPARSAAFTQPDACTLCHVERTRRWAAIARAKLWTPSDSRVPDETPLPEVEMRLLAGDPIERVLSAHALGAAKRARGGRTDTQVALLLNVMEHDPYPAVRNFARDALGALSPNLAPQLAKFVPESTPSQRASFMRSLPKHVVKATVPAALITSLRTEAAHAAIEIGE